MLTLRYRRLWLLAGLLLLAVVLGSTLAPNVHIWHRHGALGWLRMSDKWLHGITFFLMAAWYSGQLARRNYWLLGLFLLAFGAAIEIFQSMLPYRTAEVEDFLANLGGVSIGLLLAFLGLGGWSVTVENWLQKRFG